jgi:hypothetical protein
MSLDAKKRGDLFWLAAPLFLLFVILTSDYSKPAKLK